MFSLFERLLKPTDPPEQAAPPSGLIAFFWHFARQAKGLFAALFAAGLVVALLDSTIPVFMGRIITLITARPPDELFARFWPHLLGMALVLLVARPLALTAQNLIANQGHGVHRSLSPDQFCPCGPRGNPPNTGLNISWRQSG